MRLLTGIYKGILVEKFYKNDQELSQKKGSLHTRGMRGQHGGKKRLNVIILTHMSSGSSFTGNIFNLHPDVFYLYEPLHDLRKVEYEEDWIPLNKTMNDAYKIDFSNLLRDLFTCEFKEETTLRRIFAEFLNVPKRIAFMYWRLLNSENTKDRKSTRLNSSHVSESRMPSSA